MFVFLVEQGGRGYTGLREVRVHDLADHDVGLLFD
jgi:hypothetical protein